MTKVSRRFVLLHFYLFIFYTINEMISMTGEIQIDLQSLLGVLPIVDISAPMELEHFESGFIRCRSSRRLVLSRYAGDGEARLH